MKKVAKTNKLSLWQKLSNIITIVLAAVAVVTFVGALILKFNHETFSINNKETRLVVSGSMGKCDDFDTKPFNIKSIEKGDAVIIEKAPTNKGQSTYVVDLNNWVKENVETGDVLTFSYIVDGKQVIITHRVIDIKNFEDGYQIKLRGDYSENGQAVGTQIVYTNTSNPNPFNTLIGEVIRVSPFLGGFMTILTSKITLFVLIIIPCCVIIIYNIIRIVVTLEKDKKEKELVANKKREQEMSEKDKEIAELKKQLLEQMKDKE